MSPVRIGDVAKRAGVHPATVSRALNPGTRGVISTETIQRVKAAARELGYQPNSFARGLRTSRSMTIGLVIPDITNPIFPFMVRGVEDVVQDANYSVLVANTDNDPERQKSLTGVLRARQIDGCIFATAQRDDPFLRETADSGLPVVLANRVADGFPAAIPDYPAGVASALAHLVERGHRRIAHLTGPSSLSTVYARAIAFQAAVLRHRLPPTKCPVVECDTLSEAAGARGMGGLLDGRTRVTAVLCDNDLLALGCFDALAERGLQCPQDLSVVGFNDMPFVDKLRPALTTVRVPHREVGAEAARLLLDRLRNPEMPTKSVVLPVELVVRESTGTI